MVIHKKNPDAKTLELSGVLERVYRIAREAADLLCDDKIKGGGPGILYHTVKGVPAPRAGAGDPLVRVYVKQFPIRIALNAFPEIAFLALKGIGLILLIRGHPAISSNAFHRPPRSRLLSYKRPALRLFKRRHFGKIRYKALCLH